MKLTDIVKAWESFRRANGVTQQLVLNRMEKCDSCPQKRQMLTSGGLQSGGENKEDSVYYCGMCGCPFWNKLKDPKNGCPINRWLPETDPESYY